jgi:hypothetical protein
MRDLVVLCADTMWTATLGAILSRHESLGLPRRIDADVRHIPGGSDGGARTQGAKILRYERPNFAHALLVFDHDGCGDPRPPEQIQQEIDEALDADWHQAARTIVVAPEVEAWIMGCHRHFEQVHGLKGIEARRWLEKNGHWLRGVDKPADPKAALAALFAKHGAKLSSANYGRIMKHASLSPDRCACPSYRLFCGVLRTWFGGSNR